MMEFEKLVPVDLHSPESRWSLYLCLKARVINGEPGPGPTRRDVYQICYQETRLVQHAIDELGHDDVRGMSQCTGAAQHALIEGMLFMNGPSELDTDNLDHLEECKHDYFQKLSCKLADAYVTDPTKMHLQKYVDDKFGADLGL